jgi:hypothetical protein
MDKALRQHTRMIEMKLKEWEKQLKHASKEERLAISRDIRHTYRYQLAKTHDFQHERLIHLLVTLFFGTVFLFSLVILYITQTLGLTVIVLDLILATILLVTELFYIRHYYVLENGVQYLYKLTDKMVLLITD